MDRSIVAGDIDIWHNSSEYGHHHRALGVELLYPLMTKQPKPSHEIRSSPVLAAPATCRKPPMPSHEITRPPELASLSYTRCEIRLATTSHNTDEIRLMSTSCETQGLHDHPLDINQWSRMN
ncbi:hypothetical protein WN48_07155 [Eufriesea mexicana]|uniref:Uncharacterized protein n=1 Tax=Eufriesea mexicana TaxID=516756 RepID=A0A310SSQ2_9HYME|nr:hypothetical protein WN48_07155 [Eufriesea mexicana]